jgi:release factor glutamine methyltransferase
MKIRRWIGRARQVWFRLFEAHRHRRLALEHVEGLDLVSLPETMNPALFSAGRLLADVVAAQSRPGMRVLDMGAGTGIVGLRAAAVGASVVAVDVNPAAARCARINALLNRLEERMAVLDGDLFEPIGDSRFDIVAFNPPFYRGAPRDAWDLAWRSPNVAERFAAGLSEHLAADGWACVVLSTSGDAGAFLRAFRAARLSICAMKDVDLGYERLTVYRIANEANP